MTMWVKVILGLLGLVGLGAIGYLSSDLRGAKAPATAQLPAVVQGPGASAPASRAAAASSAEAPQPSASASGQAAATASGQPPAAASASPGATTTARLDPAAGGAAAPAAGEPAPPQFDVVRVEPGGDFVVAGRAPSGSKVELLRNGAVHERTTVDATGQFAMVPPKLDTGTHELTLVLTTPDGRSRPSAQSVTVAIPGGGAPPVVALSQPDKPTQILSALAQPAATAQPGSVATAPTAPQPGAAPTRPAQAPSGGERTKVAVLTVEVEEGGRLYATGQAQPGAAVRLYLNDTYLATATASPDGRWSLTVSRGVEPGAYRVRADDVEQATGKVLSRAEVPFDYSPRLAAVSPRPGAQAGAGGTAAPVRPVPSPAPAAVPAGTAAPVAVASPAPSGAGVAPTASGSGVAPASGAGSAAIGAAGSAAAPAATPAATPGATPAGGTAGTAGTQVAAAPAGTLSGLSDVVVPEVRTTLVSRGDSLWRISKRIYGKGVRYTVIYDANQPQIRDPNRIYPGQMFVLPTDKQP